MSEITEQELLEAIIPETRYGYWITAEGEFLPVGYQAHTTSLRSLIGYGSTMMDAYERSWIRVGSNVREAPNMLFVHFMESSLTARSFSAIRRLAATQDFSRYYLTIVRNGQPNQELAFADGVNDRAKFLAAVQEYGKQARDDQSQAA